MIVTPLTEELFKLYGKKILGRELTKEEKKKFLTFNNHKLTYARNKYYREINVVIEEGIKQIGGMK